MEEESAEDAEEPRRARRRGLVLLVALAVLAAGGTAVALAARTSGPSDCGGGGRTLDGIVYEDAYVEVTSPEGETARLCVLVADTPRHREHGLMRVTDLGQHDGMVFVHEMDDIVPFWMLNTPMPLSIAWFRADGSFVSSEDMDPCESNDLFCPRYAPAGPYRYVLEVPKGELAEAGVKEGARLKVTDKG